MGTYHKVVQGEYLSQIAAQYGFAKYQTIWDHAANAPLKKQRPSPNVLYPGDKLFIPDKHDKQSSAPTDRRSIYQVPSFKVQLRIRLRDLVDLPLKQARYKLLFQEQATSGCSDGSGLIQSEVQIRKSHAGKLTVADQDSVIVVQSGIRVGHLNPAEKPSGQMARLNNLGYFAGSLSTGCQMDQGEAVEPAEQLRFRSAVEEFQCDHHLAVDGKCGPKTQAKLMEVYGC